MSRTIQDLNPPPGLNVYLALGHTDMRKSITGLSILVSEVLEQDPLSGHLFVFCNRRKNILKILYWDQNFPQYDVRLVGKGMGERKTADRVSFNGTFFPGFPAGRIRRKKGLDSYFRKCYYFLSRR